MKTSYAVFAVVFAVSMLIGIQAVEVVDANPVGMFGQKPKYAIVTIDSPAYSTQLSFTIKTNYYWATGNNLTDSHCFVVLDSKSFEANDLAIVSNTTISDDYAYDPYVQFILKGIAELLNSSSLSSGTHMVEVNYGYYNSGWLNRRYTVEYISLGSATSQIILTKNITQKPTSPSPAVPNSLVPTPTPSQSMPTINTGATLPVELNPSIINIIIVILIVIMAVASISLVYFRRIKNKLASKQSFL
jgi:hypothetical protein